MSKQFQVSGHYTMNVEAETEEEAIDRACDKIGNGWHWEAEEVRAPRTFTICKTEKVVRSITLTEAEMREVFPNVRWDEGDVSHAGDAEDSLGEGGPSDPEIQERLMFAGEVESAEWRIWEN
jgi:hypothetical protein